jgi:hypothetical protein
MTADRRYLDFDAQDDGDEVVLNMKEIRKAMKFMWEQTHRDAYNPKSQKSRVRGPKPESLI